MKNRANTAAAILSNQVDLENAYVDALGAEGSAYAENEKYLDSIQGKLDQFTNAVQTMWNNTLDDSWIKDFVEFGTEIVKVIDKLGLIPSLLIAIGSSKGIASLFKSFKDSGITIQSVLKYINSLTVGFQQNAAAQTLVNAETLKQDAVNKLLKNSIIQRIAQEQLDAQIKEANLVREVKLIGLKQALELAEEQYAEGLIDDIALQTAKNAVDSASVPVTLSQFSATELLGAAFKGLALSIWGAVKAIAAFLFTNPIGWMILFVGAVAGGVAIFKHFNKSVEELSEELSNLQSELSDIRSELDSVNNELKTTQERIDELLGKDKLSFTEEEELKQLQKTNDELQRQVDLLALKEKQKKEETAKKFVDKMKTDVEDDDEYRWFTDEDNWWDKGLVYGSETEYMDHQLELYEDYQKQKAQIEQDIINAGGEDTKKGKELAKDKKEIDEKIEEIQNYINGKTDEWTKDANGLDYGISPETDKWLDYIADIEDKWAIISGGTNAKSNAVKRILNKEEFEDASEEVNNLIDQLEAGADESTIKEQIEDIISKNDALKTKLEELGITADEAARCFTQLGEAAQDAVVDNSSITDSLSKISSLEDAFNSLGDAMKELREDGTASAGTLKELMETFSDVDGFEELYKILATGEGNVEEAITNVANAYIAQKNLLSDLTDEELQIMVARLESLGVINAQEILLNRQTLQQELDEKLQGYNIDLSAYSTVEQAKEAIANAATINICSAVADMETELREKYGVNLSDFVSTEEAKVIAAKRAAKEIAKANKETAISNVNNDAELTERQVAEKQAEIEREYRKTISSIDSISTNVGEVVNSVASTLDSYYNKTFKFDFSENKIGIGRDYADEITDKQSKDSDSALEKLKKKYERQISHLENQQTYIENEISRLEAEDKQVGKALYEEQIRLENEKLALYEKERKELLAQMSTVTKNSDEWDDYATEIWGVEHAIQESTLKVLEFKDAITQLYVDAFGKIEDAFENQQKLYDYQQQYIRNNIEYAELLDQPVSADSYKKLYSIQEEAIASAQKEAESLQETLNKGLADGSIKEGSEEFVDLQNRIYDAKIEAQEARNEMVKINDELKELYITAFDKVKEAYDALDKLYADRQQYAETYMEYMKLIDEDNGLSVGKDTYTYLIDQENNKLQANMQELESLRAKLTDAVNNGDVTVGSEEWIELESNIRETEYAILENKKALEEYNKELKQLYVDAFNNVKDAFGNKNDIYEDQQSYIEGYMDYLEALGIDVPTEMYDKLIAVEEEKKEVNLQQLEVLRNKLADMEANGYTADNEEWVQAQADIRACEKAILDSDIATAKWNKTIQEMNTENFEEFIKRIEHTISELENVYDLLSKKDVADEQGNWTEEGITSLGLMYQKMQIAQRESKEYADEIEKLNREYESGEISEQDYTDRLVELQEAQWDSIKSYEDAKDAIVDLNEARVDMIEDGIQKEISAFEELIQLKKDELSAEKDLYDFRKNIQSQTKDIAALERKIAAMSGSTDAATIAQKSKLEAQLREARESLDDTYFNHANDSASNAYDDELDSYTKSKEDYVEQLREALKDVEKIVADSMAQVLINADTVLNGLNNVSSEYGVTLSGQLMLPWQNAATKVEEYRNMLSLTMEDFLLQNGIFSGEITDQINQLFGQGSLFATGFEEVVNTVISNIRTSVEESTSPLTENLTLPFDTALDRAQNTFSPQVMTAIDAVAQKAAEKSPDEENNLTHPWEGAKDAANTFGEEAENVIKKVADQAASYSPTLTEDLTTPPEEASTQWGLFGDKIANVLSQMIADAKSAADKIGGDMQGIINDAQRAADAIANTGSSGGNSGGGGSNGKINSPKTTPTSQKTGYRLQTPSESDVKALQNVLNSLFSSGLTVDGKLGPKTKTAIAKAQKTMYLYGNETMKSQDGLYGIATRAAMIDYINKKIDNLRTQGGSSMIGQGIQRYNQLKSMLPKAFYAKGTMGTSKDQWAITDEPQFGDELVLIPGASGNLSYMRKGTSVVPADITKRIFDLAQTPTNELGNNLVKVSIPNVSTNNNIELTFDTLLKVENATKETIPELKKLVQEQLDVFARKLNYGIKRVGQ